MVAQGDSLGVLSLAAPGGRDAEAGADALQGKQELAVSLTEQMPLAKPVSVLTADIDHFKQFNDAFGHEAGDLLLRELGSLFSAHVRGGDVACRYGGEEFLLILTDTGAQTARERAEKLAEQVRSMHVRHHGETLRRVTLSIGVAEYSQHWATAALLVTAADEALYKAKAQGRDRVVVVGKKLSAPAS